MQLTRLECRACGAPLDIPPDAHQVVCAYCGTRMAVERPAGARPPERLAGGPEERAPQSEAGLSQAVLTQISLTQRLSATESQLAAVQSELRSLARQKQVSTVRRQTRELLAQQQELQERIHSLQASLALSSAGQPAASAQDAPAPGIAESIAGYGGRSWLTTFLLCVFLGWLGIHRFYTRHVKSGLVQMFSLGGFGLWWLSDLLSILLGRFRDAEGLPLADTHPAARAGLTWALVVYVIAQIVFASASSGQAAGSNAGPGLMIAAVVFALVYAIKRRRRA